MQRKSFADMECPIARALDELGDGWSLLILRTAMLGTTRFADFQERIAIPPNTLARRLETLTEQGFFVRARYERHPPRAAYLLTAKGLEVLPVLLVLSAWGNRWLAPGGAPLECVDPRSGRTLEPIVVDRTSGRELLPGAVAVRPGPGASRRMRANVVRPVVLGASRESAS
jgi:DNA-binding HxlR family transcriptional regulator